MEARFLLDTNTASYLLKRTSPAALRRLARTSPAEVAISSVTEAELRFGIARLPNATRLATAVEEFLQDITILSWDSGCARVYAKLRASLQKEGLSMAGMDLMIASHALALQVILVTHDQVFSKVRQLRLQDWTK
jgi:tRNA(fMet)-specific endonuclease VapC